MDEWATGMDGALKNFVNNIENGMDAVKALAVEILKLFMIRGISSVLGSSDWFSGSLFSLPGNANGTPNWRGGLTWVGERGKELVNLPRGSQVIPNHQIGAAGGGVVLNYMPQIDATGADPAAIARLEARMDAEARTFEMRSLEALRSGQNKGMI
jgi:hypothetical protein